MNEYNQVRSFTREELYSSVWSKPVVKLAERFGLSGRGLGKLCQRHRIPVPWRGYWQRVHAKLKVRRTPLPQLRPEEQALSTIRIKPRTRFPSSGQRGSGKRREIEPIVSPSTIRRYHPLVSQTRKALQAGQSKGLLDIDVSAKMRSRALRIMDTLIRALEHRGYQVGIHGKETLVSIDEVDIGIRLEEKRQRVPVQPSSSTPWYYPDYRREPTGQLALKIKDWEARGLRQTWADGKRQRVELMLAQFVCGLVAAAEQKKQALREREERMRRWEEERQIEQARRRKLRIEQARIEEFARQTEAWSAHRRMRRYLAFLTRTVEEAQAQPDSELVQWLHWADSYLQRTDPHSMLQDFVMPSDEE